MGMDPIDWEEKNRENAKNKMKVPDGDKAKAGRLWGVVKGTGNTQECNAVSSATKGEKGEQENESEAGTGEGDG
jgi:hypothetical protein